jgi:hypothetical protein
MNATAGHGLCGAAENAARWGMVQIKQNARAVSCSSQAPAAPACAVQPCLVRCTGQGTKQGSAPLTSQVIAWKCAVYVCIASCAGVATTLLAWLD